MKKTKAYTSGEYLSLHLPLLVKTMKNYMCDGSHCRDPHGEVRVFPLNGANLILCHACWLHENQYREMQGKMYARQEDWPQRDWNIARTYPEE